MEPAYLYLDSRTSRQLASRMHRASLLRIYHWARGGQRAWCAILYRHWTAGHCQLQLVKYANDQCVQTILKQRRTAVVLRRNAGEDTSLSVIIHLTTYLWSPTLLEMEMVRQTSSEFSARCSAGPRHTRDKAQTRRSDARTSVSANVFLVKLWTPQIDLTTYLWSIVRDGRTN
jgi:hypothetical protein